MGYHGACILPMLRHWASSPFAARVFQGTLRRRCVTLPSQNPLSQQDLYGAETLSSSNHFRLFHNHFRLFDRGNIDQAALKDGGTLAPRLRIGHRGENLARLSHSGL